MDEVVTILGARGLIGKKLAKLFETQGVSPWCPRRDEDQKLFDRPLGSVFYCAGLTADYFARPFDTVDAHVSLLARILKNADFERLVYLSSTRLYDSLGDIKASEDAQLRLSPAEPRHLYDLSKALGENLCLTSSGGRAKVVRLSCVLGTNLEDTGFIPDLLKQTRGRSKVEVSTSPFFERDYIGVNDVVDLLIRILREGKKAIYNVASGVNVTNESLFKLINKLTGCVVCGTSMGRVNLPLIDTGNIRREFGFVPTKLEDLLINMLSEEGSHDLEEHKS